MTRSGSQGDVDGQNFITLKENGATWEEKTMKGLKSIWNLSFTLTVIHLYFSTFSVKSKYFGLIKFWIQMDANGKTTNNTMNPLLLCTICDINTNVPSAELGSLASIQEQTQKWVTLLYIGDLLWDGSMLTSAAPTTVWREAKLQSQYSSICIWLIIQSLPYTNALDDEEFSGKYREKLSWKAGGINEWVCYWLSCSVWLQDQDWMFFFSSFKAIRYWSL